MLNYEVRLKQLYEDKNNFQKKKEEFIQRFDGKIKEIDNLIAQLEEYKKQYEENAKESLKLVDAANQLLVDKKAWEVQDPDNASVKYVEPIKQEPAPEEITEPETPEDIAAKVFEQLSNSNNEANAPAEPAKLSEETTVQDSEPEQNSSNANPDNLSQPQAQVEPHEYSPEYEVPEDKPAYDSNVFKTKDTEIVTTPSKPQAQTKSSDDDEPITRPKKLFDFNKK